MFTKEAIVVNIENTPLVNSSVTFIIVMSTLKIRLGYSLVHLDCLTLTICRHFLSGSNGDYPLHQSC